MISTDRALAGMLSGEIIDPSEAAWPWPGAHEVAGHSVAATGSLRSLLIKSCAMFAADEAKAFHLEEFIPISYDAVNTGDGERRQGRVADDAETDPEQGSGRAGKPRS